MGKKNSKPSPPPSPPPPQRYSPPRPRTPTPPPSPLSSGSEDEDDKMSPIWSFKDRHGIWQKYGHKGEWGRVDIRSARLEKIYQSNSEAIVKFSSNSYQYEIDMGRMIQTNLETKVERPVRRKGGELVLYNGCDSYQNQNQVKIREVDPSETDLNGFDGDILSIIQGNQESKLQVFKIRAIMNSTSKMKFERAKLQMENNLESHELRLSEMYHCTSEKCALSIAQEGFDPQKRIAYGKLFGVGSYFTPDFRVAHSYSTPVGTDQHTVIIADVLIGNHTPGKECLNNAPHLDTNYKDKGRYNSCTGNHDGKRMNVIFKKDQIHPKFIVTYKLL